MIKRRKAEFSKTEREIDERLAETEGKEEDQSRAASPENSDESHSQVDAKTTGQYLVIVFEMGCRESSCK